MFNQNNMVRIFRIPMEILFILLVIAIIPVAGQYGIAEGKIQTNSVRSLPMFGKPPVLMTGLCKRYRKQVEQHELGTTNV